MCGIAGVMPFKNFDFEDVLPNMLSDLRHRGPDSQGIWIENENRIGLIHARLAILDLSETGHQPMYSNSGKLILVFNGEIYNHLEIRKILDRENPINWQGTSDTETILHAFETWGIEKSLEFFTGMFAIAIWNRETLELHLIRDRMGEKPLYYGWVKQSFVFSSEIKPFKNIPGFANEISRDAIQLFLENGSIADPYSIYENIYKLEPGKILTVDFKSKKIKQKQYWNTAKNYAKAQKNQFRGSENEAVLELESLLKRAVNLQMHSSDVPIGSFLSGGVDSSLVTALMQSQSDSNIHTFSIGFEAEEYNESEYAKAVAKHLKTNHFETYVTDKDALEIVPKLAEIYTEPFSESSQIPTFLLSKITREKVTVSLSGDAGDELFAGYSRYQLANSSWQKINKIPFELRKMMAFGINNLPSEFWYYALFPFKNTTNKIGKPINFSDKLLKASPLLCFKDRGEFYSKGFMNHNLEAKKWLYNSKDVPTHFTSSTFHFHSFFDEMMLLDQITYLPNNNLVKVDRAAMANALEVRVPFLDHHVIQFAQSLPLNFKIKDGVEKWILKEILYKYVPKNLIERPKKGFSVPLSAWMKGPLKEWIEELLDEKKLREQGFFNAELIQTKWKEHLSGKRNWQNLLWDVVVFQSWLEKNK